MLSSIAAIASVLAVVIAGGGVVVAYRTLSGGGPQPEKYAPASTFAFAKVDLDPAASEKIAVYRLARKFPSSVTNHLTNADQLRDRLLQLAFRDTTDPHVDYDHDIKPWLGARVGVAGFLDHAKKPQALGIVQVKDRAKAGKALTRIARQDTSMAYELKSDYALFASNRAVIDDAVRQAESANLSKNAHFADDMHALGGGQLVTGWADLDQVAKAFPIGDFLGLFAGGFAGSLSGGGGGFATPAQPGPAPSPLSAACLEQLRRATQNPTTTGDPFSAISARCRRELHLPTAIAPPPPSAAVLPLVGQRRQRVAKPKISGRLAPGLHVRSSYVELVVRGVRRAGTRSAPTPSVRDLVTGLPNDTVGALAVSGIGTVKSQFNDPANAELKGFLSENLRSSGLDLNIDDLFAALGDSIAVSVGNVPDDHTAPLIGVRTRPADRAAAQRVVSQLNKHFASSGGPTIVTRDIHGDLVVADFASYADKLVKGGRLGDQKLFQQAVGPLNGSIVELGYVDLRRILDAQPDHGGAAHALTAIGFSFAQSGGDAVMRVRVVAG